MTCCYQSATRLTRHLLCAGRDESAFLLSVCEDTQRKRCGVCFVDTSTSSFQFAEFTDDEQRTSLRTLVNQLRPVEVVYPRGQLSEATEDVIKKELHGALFNVLQPVTEFWDAGATLRELRQGDYFPADGQSVPSLLLNAADTKPLALSAVGGSIYYLRRVMLDKELVSLGNFHELESIESIGASSLALDGQTLQNLEVGWTLSISVARAARALPNDLRAVSCAPHRRLLRTRMGVLVARCSPSWITARLLSAVVC
jgi:DNA mismatch repair ATPase MutS